LKPLPDRRWDPVSWAVAKVGPDYRLQFQKGFYTVPYRYIGEQVMGLRLQRHGAYLL
jgi:hypothetical protein